LPAAVSNLNR